MRSCDEKLAGCMASRQMGVIAAIRIRLTRGCTNPCTRNENPSGHRLQRDKGGIGRTESVTDVPAGPHQPGGPMLGRNP